MMIKKLTILSLLIILSGCSNNLGADLELSISEKISIDGIEKVLEDKTIEKKIDIKSTELAKVSFDEKFTKNDIEIEIIGNIKKIDGGIELFAKAWKDGKQLGFGKDGTVEIERFRFYNPPVLIDDENGDIIREWEEKDMETKEMVAKQRKLKYDPTEAIKNSLIQIVEIVSKENAKIIKDKVGNTTSTFYSTTGDLAMGSGGCSSWSSARGGYQLHYYPDVTSLGDFRISDWYSNLYINRSHHIFDTSALESEDVSSCNFSLYCAFVAGNFSSHNGWYVVNSSSTWSVFSSSATTAFCSETNITSTGYKNISLNSSGISNLNKTGNSLFGIMQYWDFVNTDPNQGDMSKTDSGTVYFADETGVDTDPKLVVEHEASAVRRIISIE